MCLGIPGRIVQIHSDRGLPMGIVDFGGVRREACLAYVADDIAVGDYAIVHVGFALSKVDEAEAKRTFDALREMSQLEELEWMKELVPDVIPSDSERSEEESRDLASRSRGLVRDPDSRSLAAARDDSGSAARDDSGSATRDDK